MGDELKEADFDEVRIEQVRQEAAALLEREGLSRTAAGKEIGIGSTFPAWMNGTYPGNNSAVALTVQRWLTSRQTQAATRAKLPTGPAFVETRTARLFCSLLEHAQFAPDFCVVVGDPGLGKTTTARAYQMRAHNTWLMTCMPATGSVATMVKELADVLGVGAPGAQASHLCRLIVRKLNGLRALLIVDEAQHLTSGALDQLRTFHDLSGCGVVLMGNRSILRALEGGGGKRSSDYAQLFSRVGQRLDRRKPLADDIEAILTAWQIEDAAVRRIARAVARKPGALRVMDKVLRQAHLRARHDGEPLNERHMLASAAQLGDEKPLEMEA